MKRWAKKRTALAAAAVVFLTAAVFFYLYFSYRPHKEYDDTIRTQAQIYGIDEALVYAVIKTESGFNPAAASGAGARGLMQIMPETGAWIAMKLYKTDYTPERLSEPAYNIELGVWYLYYLFGKFNDRDTVLVAYNAGEGNAKKWIAEGKISSPPYPETREYIKKVNRHYKWFKKFI